MLQVEDRVPYNGDRNKSILLEELLSTIKKYLPNFKLASGSELGDELSIVHVKDSIRSVDVFKFCKGNISSPMPIESEVVFKVFEGKISSPMPKALEGGGQVGDKSLAPSKMQYKTIPISLPRKDIEKHLGRTMNEAAKELKVSVSSLKRKCKGFGISWPRPNPVKRKVNDSCKDQSDMDEEENETIQGSLAEKTNFDNYGLIIKAKYANDMFRFELPNTSAKFEVVDKEIGNKFKLNPGSYKLEYLDDEEDWILLTSDQDMENCIKCKRKEGTPIRLRVLTIS